MFGSCFFFFCVLFLGHSPTALRHSSFDDDDDKMRPDHYKHKNKKRNQGGHNHGEQVETVDDMAVAAAFAVQVVETTTTMTEKANVAGGEETSSVPQDDCELPLSSSDEDDDHDKAANDIQMTKEENDNDNPVEEENQQDDAISDDDDDESDVDLSEALAKMVNEDEDDDDIAGNRNNKQQQQKTKKNGPKTEHEIDPYQTPVLELQSKFNLDLEVNENQAQRLARLQQEEEKTMEQAGKIKFHMVDEKTVVVESLETIMTRGGPLDEGTLLVLKIDFGDDVSGERPSADNDITTDNDYQKKEGTTFLPLGKIFEVFGPVSRPLYTVRLDSSPPVVSQKAKAEDCHNNVEKSIPLEEVQDKKDNNGEQVESTDTSVLVTNDVESKEDGNPNNNTDLEPEKKDPWGHNGEYTKLLKEYPDGTVYYILGEAKTINTTAIVRTSGRGCDASNVYDEEIGRNEMEYSDDEQEREAKSSRRKNKNKKGSKNIGSNNNNSSNSKGPFINNNNNGHGRRPPGTTAASMPNTAGYPQQQGYPPQQQHFPPYGSAGYQQPVHSPYAYSPQYSQQYHMPYPGHGPPHQQGGYATGQPYHPPPPPPGSHFVPNSGIPPPPPPLPQKTYPENGVPGAQNTTSGWHSSSAQQPPHPQEESDTVYYDYS